ncbi:MAG: endonuclease/exonuclease/phosphatase family protein [Alteromonadaceae bacterium]|nr:endonuclease/exonuclease/phosphatase family protein [Alteromonadaceae bacterium]
MAAPFKNEKTADVPNSNIRIATFNVSMEALNYIDRVKGQSPEVTGNELSEALNSNNQQIKNIAEIIQQVNPDIILLNEFDRTDNSHTNLKIFIDKYMAVSQKGQQAVHYPHFYQGSVNTGVKANVDLNNNGKIDSSPADTFGFGYFPGHFGMALLSKYPLDMEKIRTFQYFKWKDMPNALRPFDPVTQKSWHNDKAWQEMRLSSKSHWDIPVIINNQTIHILASHPTPPVFDGPEDRNGKRNHDEIRFWHDYITPNKGHYIYDDKNIKGGLSTNQIFVILGDQNASNVDGDAMNSGITSLLTHQNIQDPKPASAGGKANNIDNANAVNHTAHWKMRADYVLPSKTGWKVKDSAVFWPLENNESFRLIKDRQASSDHRLVWVDLKLKKTKLKKTKLK